MFTDRGSNREEMCSVEGKNFGFPFRIPDIIVTSAGNVSCFDDAEVNEVYEQIDLNLGKDAAVCIRIFKDITPVPAYALLK